MNTVYFMNCVMGNVFGSSTNPAIPTSYYIGVSTTTPSADGTNITEPSGHGYSRVVMNNLSNPVNGMVKNSATIAFPESTGNWGTVTHYVVYDAITGGNLLFYGALDTSRTVETGTTLAFRANTLTITLQNPA